MEYCRLGRSGLKVSVLSFGTWVTVGKQIDDGMSRRCILQAVERGVNFFDHAEAYAMGQAEIVSGHILKELRRESLVISSKVFWGGDGPNDRGLSRKHVFEACHAALKRLQTDYLDLYFCHRPDPDTPVEETVRAMDTLIQQGKVLYWGTSEWNAMQLAEAYAVADRLNLTPPTMEQPQYNMFQREGVEVELQPLIKLHGLGTTIWSPLAGGLLTGKYDDGIPAGSRASLEGMDWYQEELTEERRAKVRQLRAVADDLECSRAQLALAWATKHPHVSTVITGASHVNQLNENLDALAVIPKLTDEVMDRIATILNNEPS